MTVVRFDRTVGALLGRHVQAHPWRLALQADDDRVSWGELHDAVTWAAVALRAAGLRRGEHLSILLPNSVAWAVWAFAAGVCGLTVVPANTKLRAEELRYQLWQSDSVAAIVPGEEHADLLDTFAEARQAGEDIPAPALRTVISAGWTARSWATPYEPPEPAPLDDRAAPDDVALIQYTSGTTAFPKGAMITSGALLQNAAGVATRLRLDEKDRFFSPSPFFHSAGSTLLLYLGLVSAVPVYTQSRFDPAQALDVIEEEGITVYGGIDALWVNLVNDPAFSRERFTSVRKGWIAATGDLFDQIVERADVPGLVNLYGLSEASPNVTIADVEAPLEQRRTCGHPHSGFEVRIVDPDTRVSLEAGQPGEIEVRGPCVMVGYYGKSEETAEVLDQKGWLRTGDRGLLRPDGCLVYEGRYKHMLRVGGENVAAAEIENALLTHPVVAQAAAIGVPHERLTEVPAAAVVPRAGHELDPDEVVAFLEERLAAFKVPRRIEVLEELPTTGSGRVQKFRLQELLTG